ncbi:hypothetical protein IMPR6_210061 [Imperialibacter sp. EC-SDR9]|nr:hypothetical protein IMPERIA89_350039 [Imperialibacter sp. 89]CAD5288884.1 hypothetical protein IMPERIA75_620040 [Imperialibacter sp. 75]VVT14391.1 hypothetical protein IMPR6_210061 [Imperialibacter sp. EC-SDR9]
MFCNQVDQLEPVQNFWDWTLNMTIALIIPFLLFASLASIQPLSFCQNMGIKKRACAPFFIFFTLRLS